MKEMRNVFKNGNHIFAMKIITNQDICTLTVICIYLQACDHGMPSISTIISTVIGLGVVASLATGTYSMYFFLFFCPIELYITLCCKLQPKMLTQLAKQPYDSVTCAVTVANLRACSLKCKEQEMGREWEFVQKAACMGQDILQVIKAGSVGVCEGSQVKCWIMH